jgi:hypothetical protein
MMCHHEKRMAANSGRDPKAMTKRTGCGASLTVSGGGGAAFLSEFIDSESYRQLLERKPATARLWHALYMNMAALIAIQDDRAEVSFENFTYENDRVAARGVAAIAAAWLVRTVATWLSPASGLAELAANYSDRIKRMASEGWLDYEAIQFLLKEGNFWLRRGAPVKRRYAAVAALDLRLQDVKKWTWMRLAAKFCPETHEHSHRCKESLRQEVMLLEKFLNDLQV